MKLTPEQKQLAEDNIRFAYHQANYWRDQLPGFEWEDILSASQYGLVKAARSFDESRGLRFTTLCTTSIRHEILKIVRMRSTKKRKGNVLYLYENVPGTDDIMYMDLLSSEDTYPLDNTSYVQDLFKGLTEIEQNVVRMYFFEDIKQEDIASVCGFAQTHISRIIRRAIDKMRKRGEYLEQVY